MLILLLVDYIFGIASVMTLYFASLVCVGVGQIFTRPISFLSFEFFELTGKKALWYFKFVLFRMGDFGMNQHVLRLGSCLKMVLGGSLRKYFVCGKAWSILNTSFKIYLKYGALCGWW